MKTIRLLPAWLVVLALAVASGCDDGEVRGQVVPLDATDAAGSDSAIEDAGPADAGYYNPEVPHDAVKQVPLVPSPSIRFEMAGRDGDTVLVDVVGKGLGNVFGIALRIDFDQDLMQYKGTDFNELFGADGDEALYRSGIVRPGQLSLGMTHKGFKAETELPEEVSLCTIRLEPVTGQESGISFFGQRCLVVTRKLDRIEPTYLSATVYP